MYVDGVITQPEKVNLTFSTQIVYANISDEGYLIVITGERTGSAGEFSIVYNKTIFTPLEKVLILENQSIYIINLHINSSDDGQPYIEPPNKEPIAILDGPYFERIGALIQFDGTKCIDPDGSIVSYEWDFGDKSTSTDAAPTHIYRKLGNFTVTLTVTDDDGNSTQNSTYVVITRTLNYPPDKPLINGSTKGSVNVDYNFTIQSTDSDDDKIKYSIDWRDNKEITITGLLTNGTATTVFHNWTKPDVYTIKVYAIDDKDTYSEKSELVILIDTIYCQDLGYLIDKTGDGIYNFIYLNSSGLEKLVVFDNGPYLIDVDDDGEYDYRFSTVTNQLSAYVKGETVEQQASFADITKSLLPYIVIFLVLVVIILVVLIFGSSLKVKPRIQKMFYFIKKDKTPVKEIIVEDKAISAKDAKIKSIEKKVDELLAKKKIR